MVYINDQSPSQSATHHLFYYKVELLKLVSLLILVSYSNKQGAASTAIFGEVK